MQNPDSFQKTAKLTIDELRKYPGNENYSDAELKLQSNTLYELSLILYDIYMSDQDKTSLPPEKDIK